MVADGVRLRVAPRIALSERVEADSGSSDDWSFLRRAGVLGFIAILSICIGASLPQVALQARDVGYVVLR